MRSKLSLCPRLTKSICACGSLPQGPDAEQPGDITAWPSTLTLHVNLKWGLDLWMPPVLFQHHTSMILSLLSKWLWSGGQGPLRFEIMTQVSLKKTKWSRVSGRSSPGCRPAAQVYRLPSIGWESVTSSFGHSENNSREGGKLRYEASLDSWFQKTSDIQQDQLIGSLSTFFLSTGSSN